MTTRRWTMDEQTTVVDADDYDALAARLAEAEALLRGLDYADMDAEQEAAIRTFLTPDSATGDQPAAAVCRTCGGRGKVLKPDLFSVNEGWDWCLDCHYADGRSK